MNLYLNRHRGYVTVAAVSAMGLVPLILILGIATGIAILLGVALGALTLKMTDNIRDLSDGEFGLTENN